jgi:hypothetical protein
MAQTNGSEGTHEDSKRSCGKLSKKNPPSETLAGSKILKTRLVHIGVAREGENLLTHRNAFSGMCL